MTARAGGTETRDYSDYYESHVLPRDGPASIKDFAFRAAGFDVLFGDWLPADQSARILDVGTGIGAIPWWLQRRGFHNTYGVDLDEKQVAVAQRLGVDNIQQGDFRDLLRESPAAWDLIFMRDVLEHVPVSAIPSVVCDLARSLRPGGRLILQVPNGNSPFVGHVRYGDFTHQTAFTSSSLMQILLPAGFSDFQARGVEPLKRTPRERIRRTAWRLIAALFRLVLLVETGSRRAIVTQGLAATVVRRQDC